METDQRGASAHLPVDGMKNTSIIVKACTMASYECVCGRGGIAQATCKNTNKIASYEGPLVYLTGQALILTPIIDAWI